MCVGWSINPLKELFASLKKFNQEVNVDQTWQIFASFIHKVNKHGIFTLVKAVDILKNPLEGQC